MVQISGISAGHSRKVLTVQILGILCWSINNMTNASSPFCNGAGNGATTDICKLKFHR
jgi:hypothetical protein